MIYNCALKDTYLNNSHNAIIKEVTIPQLTAFFSMLHVRDIDNRKLSDDKKKKKRAMDREEAGLSEEEEEELELELPPIKFTKKGKKIELDPEVIEEAKVKALFKREMATYGRTWIWENYYAEGEERKDIWLAGAAALRRINHQVLEDIEDYIMLKTYKTGPAMLNIEGIHRRIEKDLQEKRERTTMQLATAADKKENEEEKFDDPFEIGAVEDKKRTFAVKYRPHEKIWNFMPDDPNDRLPHLLRANADPNAAYIDSRVGDVLQLTESMGEHMRLHDEASWDHITKMTMMIFQHREDETKRQMEAYKKLLEEQQQNAK